MQAAYPSTGEIFVVVWFSVSVLIEIISSTVFWLWLRRRVGLVFGLTGIPGYMENVYINWCRSQKRRPNIKFLIFRAVSVVNVVAAGIFFILLVTSR